jgi:pimeloyl-ACP methyl ester carboxylesterase
MSYSRNTGIGSSVLPMHSRLLPVVLALLSFALGPVCMTAQSPADLTAPTGNASLSGQPENLAKLDLGQHKPPAPEPFLLQRDEEPEFTRELFRVEWRTGDPIDLYVIRPAHAVKPPVTIFLYGFPSETDRFRDNTYCRMVTQRGYAAVGFVSALTGQRFHGRGLTEWFVSDLPFALVASVHDVQMVLNYLETRKDLDASSVGIFGQGSGGTIAVLAATVEPRLKKIDLIDPWGDWPVWLAGSSMILDDERPKLTTKEFMDSLAALDPVRYLPAMDSSRFQLLDVAYDRDTPAEAKKAIESAMPRSSSILRYATPAYFQAGVAGGDKLLNWLQPASMPEKQNTTVHQTATQVETRNDTGKDAGARQGAVVPKIE